MFEGGCPLSTGSGVTGLAPPAHTRQQGKGPSARETKPGKARSRLRLKRGWQKPEHLTRHQVEHWLYRPQDRYRGPVIQQSSFADIRAWPTPAVPAPTGSTTNSTSPVGDQTPPDATAGQQQPSDAAHQDAAAAASHGSRRGPHSPQPKQAPKQQQPVVASQHCVPAAPGPVWGCSCSARVSPIGVLLARPLSLWLQRRHEPLCRPSRVFVSRADQR